MSDTGAGSGNGSGVTSNFGVCCLGVTGSYYEASLITTEGCYLTEKVVRECSFERKEFPIGLQLIETVDTLYRDFLYYSSKC